MTTPTIPEIDLLPAPPPTVADHGISELVAATITTTVAFRDWAFPNARPEAWTGDTSESASHRLTTLARQGDRFIPRLQAGHAALVDFIDSVIALRTSRDDLVERRSPLVDERREYVTWVGRRGDVTASEQEADDAWAWDLKHAIDTFDTDGQTWRTDLQGAEEQLVDALSRSLPQTPDSMIGGDAYYLTPDEAAQVAVDYMSGEPGADVALGELIEIYGDDAAAWDAFYQQMGPDQTVLLQALLADQYEHLPSGDVLGYAQDLRTGLALATARWTDEENVAFAESIVDLAAGNPDYVAPAALLFSAPPGEDPAAAPAFALAGAEAVARHETGPPPAFLTSGPTATGTRLFHDATGTDTARAGFSMQVDLGGAVLSGLGEHPVEALSHLSDEAAREHWFSRDWSIDGFEGVTGVLDSALGTEGGIGFPPTLDPTTIDPAVADAQAAIAEDFFETFGDHAPSADSLTESAQTSLSNVVARLLPVIAEVTRVSGTDGGFPLLGQEGYSAVPLPLVANSGLAAAMSAIGASPHHEALQTQYVEFIGESVATGQLTSLEGLNSLTGLLAMNAAAEAGSDIAAAAAADRLSDSIVTVASAFPPLGGVTTGFSLAEMFLDGVGILQDHETMAAAEASQEWATFTEEFAAEAARYGIGAADATALLEGLDSRYFGILESWR